MNLSDVEYPSNKKFGYFFTLVFILTAAYLHVGEFFKYASIFFILAVIFFILTMFKSELLNPLNKLWMTFGMFLGIIVSPFVLGVLFFGIFTPIAFLMRLKGRDELQLKLKKPHSYWILRNKKNETGSFKNQF